MLELFVRIRSAFERNAPHVVTGWLASIALSVKHHEFCRVSFDGQDWIHRYRTGVVVETEPNGLTAAMRDDRTKDVIFHKYTPRPGDVVVEIGAGVGGEVRTLSRLVGPTGRVISVEAHPRTFRCLEKSVFLNDLQNVQAIHCAITGEEGPVFIEDRGGHVGNSVTDGQAGGLRVEGHTLAELLKRSEIQTVDFLKLNIEGAEFPVLEAFQPHLHLVRHVAVSCHDFIAEEGGNEFQRTFAKVRSVLEHAGFTLTCRPHDRRPWVRYFLYGSRP